MTAHETTPDEAARPGIRHRWPTLAGAAMAVAIWLDMSEGVDAAPAVAGSALVYLGAAALRRPSSVWLVFLGATLVILVAEVVQGGDATTWALLAVAVPFLIYGLWPGVARTHDGLSAQMIAMLGFGLVAALALGVDSDVGAYLVAAGLLGHATWDAIHYRANRVVVRPFAELCASLDTLIAVFIVILTVQG